MFPLDYSYCMLRDTFTFKMGNLNLFIIISMCLQERCLLSRHSPSCSVILPPTPKTNRAPGYAHATHKITFPRLRWKFTLVNQSHSPNFISVVSPLTPVIVAEINLNSTHVIYLALDFYKIMHCFPICDLLKTEVRIPKTIMQGSLVTTVFSYRP